MIYRWGEGSQFSSKVKANVAGATLEAIRKKHGGVLAPKDVVAASRATHSPLHKCFEWSDTRAGALFREDQARNIIRSVKVVEDGKGRGSRQGEPFRAYVHVDAGKDGKGYVTVAHALSKADLREQILRDALGELKSWQSRYERLREFSKVYVAIEDAERGIDSRGQRLLKAA